MMAIPQLNSTNNIYRTVKCQQRRDKFIQAMVNMKKTKLYRQSKRYKITLFESKELYRNNKNHQPYIYGNEILLKKKC